MCQGVFAAGLGGGAGKLTYCYAEEQRFEEGVVLGQVLAILLVIGKVDKHCEGIFGHGLRAGCQQSIPP